MIVTRNCMTLFGRASYNECTSQIFETSLCTTTKKHIRCFHTLNGSDIGNVQVQTMKKRYFMPTCVLWQKILSFDNGGPSVSLVKNPFLSGLAKGYGRRRKVEVTVIGGRPCFASDIADIGLQDIVRITEILALFHKIGTEKFHCSLKSSDFFFDFSSTAVYLCVIFIHTDTRGVSAAYHINL